MKRIITGRIFIAILFLCSSVYSQEVQDWVRRFDGEAHGWDRPYDIAVDNSGNIYVVGTTKSASNQQDYITIKYSPDGTVLWTATYNGPVNSQDQAYAVAVGNSGNVYVTGGSFGNGTERDYLTIKYTPDGDSLWTRRYNGPGYGIDEATSIILDDSENVYVCGYSDLGDNLDYYITKYDSSGNQKWGCRWEGDGTGVENRPHDMAMDKHGNIYVTGESSSNPAHLDSYGTIKIDPSGDTVWTRKYHGFSNVGLSEAYGIAVDSIGNVYVTGQSDTVSEFGDHWNIVTIKYSSSGRTGWVKRITDPQLGTYGVGNDIAVDKDGNIIVVGGAGNFLSITIKYTPSGDTLWTAMYGDPLGNGFSMALDNEDNIYITGIVNELGGNLDFGTWKYNSQGILQWTENYNGPANGDDEPVKILLDEQGNVYVTGQSPGNGTGQEDFATIKYSSTITPVEVTAFTALDEGKNVSIRWLTATETNNKGFEVQRQIVKNKEHSKNAKWQIIGFVEGSGTSSGMHSYSYTDKNVIPGKYYYRLNQIDFDGTSEYSKEVEVSVNAPAVFALQQNYPNPFNPATIIRYSIPADQHVRLNIYNLLGQKVVTLIDGVQKAGQHEVNFNASNLPAGRQGFASGLYFYKLEAGENSSIKKMILMK